MKHTPATKVTAMRKATKVTQVQLAQALGVAQSLISACEAGKTSPADLLIRLGNFAAANTLYADAIWFWRKAGIDAQGMAQATRELSKARVKDMTANRHGEGTVNIPLLDGYDYVAAPSLAPPESIEEWIPLPTRMVSKPASTSLIKPSCTFDLLDFGGDTLALVDASETAEEKLWGQLVAVYEPDDQDQWTAGCYVGWLHNVVIAGRQLKIVGAFKNAQDIKNIGKLDKFPRLHERKGIEALALGSGILAGLQGIWLITVEGRSRILGRVTGWVAAVKQANSTESRLGERRLK